MSTYFEFTEPFSQDMTSQDSSQHKSTNIYDEDNEYYEDEVEDATNLEEGDEEEGDAWDDSALIAAWDIAVKEYQDFHSIKANKTDTKSDKKIPTSSNNKVMETEKLVNIIKEDEIESFVQQDISPALNDIVGTSSFVMKTSIKEQEQNIQKLPEQKIKETRQIKPQTVTKSTPVLTKDTSYQPQPIRTTTYSSYSHHFPGYYSYPPPSSSTTPIPPHSFGEQTKGTTDIQEDQEEESQLPPTGEATTSYSNTNNVHDPYYSYGWYPNYYPPPPPPPPPPPGSQQPIPPPQFYSSIPTDDPNTPFSGWRPKPPDMAPPMPGFDDEALTNLIMAWYYSGYYTGLYQGRKGR